MASGVRIRGRVPHEAPRLGAEMGTPARRTAAVQLRAERRSGLRIEPPLRVHRYVLRSAMAAARRHTRRLALAGVMEDLESAAPAARRCARVRALGAGVARQIVDVASQPRLAARPEIKAAMGVR